MTGTGQQLYMLSFDHRGSFKNGLMRILGEPTDEERLRISALEDMLIYKGFMRAIADGAPRASCAVLVDEEFGAGIARAARRATLTLAMPWSLRSGRVRLRVGPAHFGRAHQGPWTPTTPRCSCATTPTATPSSTAARRNGSRGCPAGCARTMHKFLFELLVPARRASLRKSAATGAT